MTVYSTTNSNKFNNDSRLLACFYFSFGYLELIGERYQKELETLLVRMYDHKGELSTYWTDIPSLPTLWAIATAWGHLDGYGRFELVWVKPHAVEKVSSCSIPGNIEYLDPNSSFLEYVKLIDKYHWSPFPTNLNEELLQKHRDYINELKL